MKPTPEFRPWADPATLLRMGIFDGTYFANDPSSCPIPLDQVTKHNYYKPGISKPRQYWLDRGWITPEDPLGWFQWYCRYHQGRRIPDLDHWQITRWHNFRRHSQQIIRYGMGDPHKRRGQRQALLHWAHDPEPDRALRVRMGFDQFGVRI